MTKLLGIPGSLRRHSFNSGLLRAAKTALPPGASLEFGDISQIPLYNGDVEQELGLPDSVRTLKEAVAGSDGLLLATPEYNNGIPGVFKNAIDWLSRPSSDIPRIFGKKPIALMGASPGGFGTILSQTAWLPVFRTLGAEFWTGGRLVVPNAAKAFDESGNLTDEGVRERLARFLVGFVASINSADR